MLDIKKCCFFLLSVVLLLIFKDIYAGDTIDQTPIEDKIISGAITFSGCIDGTWQIWSINPDGANLTQITHSAQDVHSPSWSPDSNKLAYTASDGGIYILEQGKTPRKLPTQSLKCSHPSWSPDGSKLVFVCLSFTNGQEESDIWLAELKDNKVYKLIDIPGIQKDPEWSPDGNFILYTTGYWTPNSELKEELWVVDMRNMSTKQLIPNGACTIQPSWSPDGEWIAFSSDRNGNMEIWIIDKNGKNAHQITHNNAFGADPCWSPDGNKICFISTREGKMDIWLMDKDGTKERKITNVSEEDCKDPFWQ